MDEEQQARCRLVLDQIEEGMKTLRSLLGQTPKPEPEPELIPGPIPEPSPFIANSLPASELGPPPDYNSEDWPEAVDPDMIVSSDADKHFRALHIVPLIPPMQGKFVLDCGCGEGYNSAEFANSAAQVIGYDLKENEKWVDHAKDNLIFTADKQIVTSHRFNLIVLYDVIDHIVGDPEDFFIWIAGLLTSDGEVYIRAHPWTGRTGGHAYESINKAYIHLALTPDELPLEHNVKTNQPMAAYEQWFKAAGLKIEGKNIFVTEVEEFFSGAILDRMIKINWGGIRPEAIQEALATHFIDYRLSRQ
jgi:SAM-dependent methyltransferase